VKGRSWSGRVFLDEPHGAPTAVLFDAQRLDLERGKGQGGLDGRLKDLDRRRCLPPDGFLEPDDERFAVPGALARQEADRGRPEREKGSTAGTWPVS